MTFEVKRIENEKELDLFVKFPLKLYQSDPYYVSPLFSDVKRTLNTLKNPFFKHAVRELFIARDGNNVLGRIAAIID
jgi:hypothetical protein